MNSIEVDENFILSGDFVKIVGQDNRYYVVDKDGKVLSTTYTKDIALDYANARWAVEPNIVEYKNVTYVGRIFVLVYDLDLGWVISKGKETLYILDSLEKALERLKVL